MISAKKAAVLVALTAMFAGAMAQSTSPNAPAASTTSAGTSAPSGDKAQWDKDHPRRAEVNKRLANQNKRIKAEEKQGEISAHRADKLHAEDRAIRKQERADAAKNGGHITKAEKRKLNREEDKVSNQIGK